MNEIPNWAQDLKKGRGRPTKLNLNGMAIGETRVVTQRQTKSTDLHVFRNTLGIIGRREGVKLVCRQLEDKSFEVCRVE